MGAPSGGDVVLVPFPFSDLTGSKLRPAACLASAGRGDWIFCQITSNPYGDDRAIVVNSGDFEVGGLAVSSYARPAKLFTAHESLLVRTVGRLSAQARRRLLDAVIAVLDPESPL